MLNETKPNAKNYTAKGKLSISKNTGNGKRFCDEMLKTYNLTWNEKLFYELNTLYIYFMEKL